MAYFVVRVELHELDSRRKPAWEDYERLHTAMQRSRYWRVIKGGDGQWYHMPYATYFAEFGNKTSATVLDEVTNIVQTVWVKAGKLVTEGPSTWNGLTLASTQDVQRLTS